MIGDAGLTKEDLSIVKNFPRVRVFNHHKLTLGYSLRLLVKEVNTELFAYLHSDVYLPENWYEDMSEYTDKYDWFGCKMYQTTLWMNDQEYGERPYAGAQIGRKEVFDRFLGEIDDDYVWRQEDFVHMASKNVVVVLDLLTHYFTTIN